MRTLPEKFLNKIEILHKTKVIIDYSKNHKMILYRLADIFFHSILVKVIKNSTHEICPV